MAVRDVRETRNRERGAYKTRKLSTFKGRLIKRFDEELKSASEIRWPNERADTDPIWFFEKILGIELWPKQKEAVLATLEHDRVAVSSGHKIGKSKMIVGLGLSKYCAYDDSRVIFTSTTSRQIDNIIWRELQMTLAAAGRCVDCKRKEPNGPRPCPHSALIDGQIGDLARTGLKSGFRELVGFTARDQEAVAGISGAHLWYFLDEASGIPDKIFHAIYGNRAGKAPMFMISNPTKTDGEYFAAFHNKKHFWYTSQISSIEYVNHAKESGKHIPGMADPAWIEEMRDEWGEDSAWFKVRVKGEFPLNEDGKAFPIQLISEAEQRWYDEPETDERLYLGLDPAGPQGTGDDSALSLRRGRKQLALEVAKGKDDESHLVWVLSYLNKYRKPGEVPVVVLDREGKIGSGLYGLMLTYCTIHPKSFELIGVRSSGGAVRQPLIYDRIRDELASNLEEWLKNGGAIISDIKLEQELHVWEWLINANGKNKLSPKSKAKEVLQRSPDRYDALALSVWEQQFDEPKKQPKPERLQEKSELPELLLDPWAGVDAWQTDE